MAEKYEIWSEMGPYGSVGAHIKTGRSPMAQDHFKTPPDPKKGQGMTKNPQKNKKSSRVGQADERASRFQETPSLYPNVRLVLGSYQ